ncbi:MAG TPA: ribokinase [Nitrososphaeraceae archaeon]|nr:ribokinase [Nitrososphaeraceae archaeon]
MNIAVASHIALDTIQDIQGTITESLGGPACYCSTTARKFNLKVKLATKVGKDFSQDYRLMLRNKGIDIDDILFTDNPTTRFRIILKKDSRELFLVSKCSPITIEDIQRIETNCWIVSPIMDEVPFTVLQEIVKDKDNLEFVMLDPQGYIRTLDPDGRVSFLNDLKLDVSGISAIKVDPEELSALTGGRKGIEGMKFLQIRKGIKFVISTEYRIIRLLYNKMYYSIKLSDVVTPHSTGVGDILTSSFCCAYLKEKDPLWAICFGAGAVQAALEANLVGLEKVPPKSKIEQNASYYYNTISFQEI